MKNVLSEASESGYLNFYGLHSNPFPVAPDDAHFYISAHIEQILTEIVHGIKLRKGFMVLTGDIGLGKTTISRRILSIAEKEKILTSLVFHTYLQDEDLLNEINRDFGLSADGLGFSDRMKRLNDFLLEQNLKGNNCVIIIDDAQNLSVKSLELVRMISNLEANQQKLVQILLVGQPELMEKLNTKDLRQLRSRIMIRKEATPLTRNELENYIAFKSNVAGNSGQITITKQAFSKIHRYTRGNLRQINILMDRCLYVGFLRDVKTIGAAIVREAFADLDNHAHVPNRKRTMVAVSLLAAALLVGWFQFQNFNAASDSEGKPSPDVVSRPVPDQHPAPDVQPETAEPADRAEPPASVPEIPEPVTAFLQAYGLSAYAGAFHHALVAGRVKEFAETIFQEKGYELVCLKHFPEIVRANYDILVYPSAPEEEKKYYLFWEPEIKIDKFYYSYQGEEIRRLQKKLSDIGMYTDRLDGNVGKNLMKAVIMFQKKMALPVTGEPNARLVFLLCRAGERLQP